MSCSASYLVLRAVEAVPAAALAFHILLGLSQVAGQTAHGFRGLGVREFKLNLWKQTFSIGGDMSRGVFNKLVRSQLLSINCCSFTRIQLEAHAPETGVGEGFHE